MRFHKTTAYETPSVPTLEASKMPPGMSLPFFTHVPPGYVLSGTSVGSKSMPFMRKTSETTSIPLRYLKYRLTKKNFVKTMKAQKKFK